MFERREDCCANQDRGKGRRRAWYLPGRRVMTIGYVSG